MYEMHSSSVCGVEDMALLQDLHEGAILHNLHLRYTQRSIYVSIKHTHTQTLTTLSAIHYNARTHKDTHTHYNGKCRDTLSWDKYTVAGHLLYNLHHHRTE